MKLRFFEKPKQNETYKLTKNINYEKREKILKSLAKDYDSFGKIKYSIGKELEEIYQDKNYEVGLHFTGFSNVDENFLNEVYEEGLINNQDRMLGIEPSRTDITKTVTFVNNFTVFIGQLKSANSYKNSQGAFIIKIPKEYLDTSLDESKRQPIYQKGSAGICHLLPEFIYGYVKVDKEGNIDTIIKNKGYRETHTNQDNDKLIYEGQNLKTNTNIR